MRTDAFRIKRLNSAIESLTNSKIEHVGEAESADGQMFALGTPLGQGLWAVGKQG